MERETESQYLRGQAWQHYAIARSQAWCARDWADKGDGSMRMYCLLIAHRELTRAMELWRRAKMWERMNGT
jgi:hypothetical protein